MPTSPVHAPLEILIVDDDRNIHQDYERCLAPLDSAVIELDDLRSRLFGVRAGVSDDERRFPLVHAFSGDQAVEITERRRAEGERFPVAFVDMRMSPGLNGVETITRMWAIDPGIEIVVSTAYSDFTWAEVLAAVGRSDGLHLLRKPFDGLHVRRFASVLAHKWQLARRVASRAS